MDNVEKKPPVFTGPKAVWQRRKYIASRLMGDAEKPTAALLAAELGVTDETIYRDLKSDQLAEVALEQVKEQLRGMGIATAWKNVYKALLAGDIVTSRWVLDRAEVFTGTQENWDAILHDVFDQEPGGNGQDAEGYQPSGNGSDTTPPGE